MYRLVLADDEASNDTIISGESPIDDIQSHDHAETFSNLTDGGLASFVKLDHDDCKDQRPSSKNIHWSPSYWWLFSFE